MITIIQRRTEVGMKMSNTFEINNSQQDARDMIFAELTRIRQSRRVHIDPLAFSRASEDRSKRTMKIMADTSLDIRERKLYRANHITCSSHILSPQNIFMILCFS